MVSSRAAAIAAALFVLAAPPLAMAHRLDEYLQQTLLELEPGRVIAHVSLTPGVDVAAEVLATIDTDHNGIVSDTEQLAYADSVERDLTLRIGTVKLPLRRVQMRYPPIESLTRGLGDISLTFEAVPPGGLRAGTLYYENHHRASDSVYLVNTLMPHVASIHVGAQSRNENQSTYRVALDVETTASFADFGRPLPILAFTLLIAAFALWGASEWPRKS